MELTCKELVFHFNKGHLQDPTIPMWVIKTGGKSYYVNHVTASATWSTKETPDNPSTKGSIKFKNVHLCINDNNDAEIKPAHEPATRQQQKVSSIRAIIPAGQKSDKVIESAESLGIKLGPIKKFGSICGTTHAVFDVFGVENWTTLLLCAPDQSGLRELMPNEKYFVDYDKYKNSSRGRIYTDDDYPEDEFYDEDLDDE